MTPKIRIKINVVLQMLRRNGFRFVFQKIIKKASEKAQSSIKRLTISPIAGVPYSAHPGYQQWLNSHYPRPLDLKRMEQMVSLFKKQPRISILLPVYNPPLPFLKDALDSVLTQVYPHWELCLVDDASSDPQIPNLLKGYAAQDSRIKLVIRENNGHISQASNTALQQATGEFIALLDHDDCLTPDALFAMALKINQEPDVDMIYSDEDKIDAEQRLSSPYFKPDWSPDTLMSQMYTCHLGVFRRTLVQEIGGFREGYEGAQDYDLVLRLSEKTQHIRHIPQILYHWRKHADSTADNLESKDYSVNASIRALESALERRAEPGTVQPAPYCHYLVRYEIKESDLVSIIIPTRDYAEILDRCLQSIFEKTQYPNFEVVVVDNGSVEPETQVTLKKWQKKQGHRFSFHRLDIPFNYSKINNEAVHWAQGKYLLFLNNDTEVLTDTWIDDLLGQAQRPSIGAVGAMLLYPDKTVQHAGIVMGTRELCGLSHQHFSSVASGQQNRLQTVQNYSAVTAACLMCRRDVFEEIGGFEEKLAGNYNDVDLCLKMQEKGYRNVYLPFVKLLHYESKSRGFDTTPEQQARFEKEAHYLQTRWPLWIEADPHYNSNLNRKEADFELNLG